MESSQGDDLMIIYGEEMTEEEYQDGILQWLLNEGIIKQN